MIKETFLSAKRVLWGMARQFQPISHFDSATRFYDHLGERDRLLYLAPTYWKDYQNRSSAP